MPPPDEFEWPYEEYQEYYDGIEQAGFDVWDYVPGIEFMDAEDQAVAFQLFYMGFIENDGRSRDDFFDFMGMEDADFPWEDWRDWMGYE